MTVIIICARYPYGSVESFLGAEIRSLIAQGLDVQVLPLRNAGVRRPASTDLRVLRLPSVSRIIMDVGWAVACRPRLLLKLLREVARDPQHVLKNLIVLPIGIGLGRQLLRVQCSHIHAHWLSTTSTVAWVASAVSGVPFSVTAHRWDVFDANLLRAKVRDASFVRAISQSGLLAIDERFGAASGGLIIHMGVAIPGRVESHLERSILPDTLEKRFSLACIGNLVPVKGHEFLLDALVGVDGNVQLEVVGSGPELKALKAKALRIGLAERVRFRGEVEHGQLMAELAEGRYDCVVHPSNDLGGGEHEGIPVALMEAMARGVPVVATATGGIPELVTDLSTGLLVPAADPQALAAAITTLQRDRDLRQRLADAGREAVRREFAAPAVAAALTRLFSQHSAHQGDDR